MNILRRNRFRILWMVGLAVLQAALFGAILAQRDGALLDDAFISFRYAARWAAGDGLTWNDGEAVEGFSNPLWTLGLGLLARTGLEPPRAAPGLGLLLLLLLPWVLLSLSRARGYDGGATLVLVGGAGLDAGLLVWAGSGLETISAAVLVALWLRAAAPLIRSPGSSGWGRGAVLGLLGAALALSRPEGGLWAFWGLVWLLWGAWAPPRVLVGWTLGMIPAGLYQLFRLTTYGEPVPNTFFAKLEPGTTGLAVAGADLLGWALAHGVILGLLLVAGRSARRRPTPAEPGQGAWLGLLAVWILLQGGFVVAAGGDWMGRLRYLAPVLPALYTITAELWARSAIQGARLRPALALLLGVHLALGWWTRDRLPAYTNQGRIVGTWLRTMSEPGETLAVSAAGAIPYYAELPTYDVLGINDAGVVGRRARHVGPWTPGHHRYDIEALLEFRPTWIVWDLGVKVNEHRMRKYSGWSLEDAKDLGFRELLFVYPEFRTSYTVFPGPAGTEYAYTVFRRREMGTFGP